MHIRIRAFVVVALLAAFVPGNTARADDAKKSPLDRFTPEQQQQLRAGEVVFEYKLNEDQKDGLGHGEAYVIIDRPADACYREMIKFGLKQHYFPRLIESEIVKSEDNKDWVHEIIDFKIAEIGYVMLMTKDPDNLRVDYRVDQAYPHDMNDSDGYYYFEAIDEKSALITYVVSSVDVGIPVPDFIMKALSSRDLPGIVANVKKRFESDGQWTKPE